MSEKKPWGVGFFAVTFFLLNLYTLLAAGWGFFVGGLPDVSAGPFITPSPKDAWLVFTYLGIYSTVGIFVAIDLLKRKVWARRLMIFLCLIQMAGIFYSSLVLNAFTAFLFSGELSTVFGRMVDGFVSGFEKNRPPRTGIPLLQEADAAGIGIISFFLSAIIFLAAYLVSSFLLSAGLFLYSLWACLYFSFSKKVKAQFA